MWKELPGGPLNPELLPHCPIPTAPSSGMQIPFNPLQRNLQAGKVISMQRSSLVSGAGTQHPRCKTWFFSPHAERAIRMASKLSLYSSQKVMFVGGRGESWHCHVLECTCTRAHVGMCPRLCPRVYTKHLSQWLLVTCVGISHFWKKCTGTPANGWSCSHTMVG